MMLMVKKNLELSKTFNFWSEKEVGGEEVPQRHTRFNSSSGDDLDSQKSDDSDDNSSESESDDNNEVERSPTFEQDEDINPSVIEQDIDSPISPFPSKSVSKPAEDESMEEKKPADTVYFSTTQILSSTLSTTVRFFNPSAYELEKCCKKVELQYLSEAYTFWSNTVIKEISPKSVPNKIFPVDNDSSGFACFSLFLTGTEINASKINVTFNQKYFIKNLIEIGKFYNEDLSQLNAKTKKNGKDTVVGMMKQQIF
uniref:Uncharacterized protein n=1 Tax=Panagrolaimus superbus TaxID=310955 RepID=A0A914Z6T6_9BILA